MCNAEEVDGYILTQVIDTCMALKINLSNNNVYHEPCQAASLGPYWTIAFDIGIAYYLAICTRVHVFLLDNKYNIEGHRYVLPIRTMPKALRLRHGRIWSWI